MVNQDTPSSSLHPIELCVYSIISNDLEGVYQSINELRESQALLILRLKQIKSFIKNEQDFFKESNLLNEESKRLSLLVNRMNKLVERYKALCATSKEN